LKQPRTTGFSLIEILLALLVISVGVVSMIGLMSSTLDSTGKARSDLEAVEFADMVFNYYHATTNWNDIPPDGNSTLPDYNGNWVDLTEEEYTLPLAGSDGQTADRYTLTYRFTADHPATHLKRLNLQIWAGYGTNGPSRTFYTELYNWNKNP
jgi:prepilin-type N-terminal cleavage/methylation domain-containing protein